MYKFRSRPRRKSNYRSTSALAGLLFLALSIVAPAQIQKAETRVFSHGLKVSVEKTSPAYAALEDELRNPIGNYEEKPVARIVNVSAGENFAAQAMQIAAENKREAQLALQRQMAQANKIQVVEVSREELLQTLFLPIVASLRNSPEMQTKKSATPPAQSVARYEVNNSTFVPPAQPTQTLKPDTSIDPNQPHLVRGLFEFRDGLALTSPTDEVTVFQEVEGEHWQEGTVWLRQGRYAIEIPNREGLLVAELRTSEGKLVGRGEIELSKLKLQKETQYKVNDITIELYPTASGIGGTVLSAYSHNDVKTAVDSAAVEFVGVGHQFNTDKDGHFEDEQLMDGSTVITEVYKKGFWKTLAVANAKSNNEIILYPTKMLRAFFELAKANDPKLHVNQDTSLVWGRITNKGKPQAGAFVELMTTDEPLTPIYFNDLMIPDPTLKATSSNGLYAFINVPAGSHAIQVSDHGTLSEPIVFPVEALHVTTINLETFSQRRMLVKSFDAFAPETKVASDIYRLGFEVERIRSATGVAELKYAPSTSLMVINSVPASREYVPERVSVARDRTYAYFPMLKAKWIKELISGRRSPGTGIAVGFVKTNRPYQVHSEDGLASVVYFDAQGKVLEGEAGMPGGGYIIFNLNPGFRTLSVVPLGSDMINAQTVLADTKFVNVINHVIQ